MAHSLRRLGWTTDVHLNFVSLREWDRFLQSLAAAELDALLITGDISEADDVVWQLERLAAEFPGELFFVLGNHDFYHGAIDDVRSRVRQACRREPRLHYLTGDLPHATDCGWVVCGDDGWADARLGKYFQSPIRMQDFRLIDDLRDLAPQRRLRVLKRLGAASAWRLLRQLQLATQQGTRLLVLTHIPPFRESCWYEGRHADDDWAPFFTCRAVGWALDRFRAARPEVEVLVLCGHTHSPGRSQFTDKLAVWTGGAQYGAPELLHVFSDVESAWPKPDWTQPA